MCVGVGVRPTVQRYYVDSCFKCFSLPAFIYTTPSASKLTAVTVERPALLRNLAERLGMVPHPHMAENESQMCVHI